MSLVGIDVGSSSVKAAAYSQDGQLLAVASHPITPLHPQPGLWEQDPEEIWQAASLGMQELAAHEAVRRDPPAAIAISASGRENFPADAQGRPLGSGIMGADIRGVEFEEVPAGSPRPEPWCLSCGHLRERMDPVFRLQWWRKYHPEIMAQARYFPGWHDYLAYQITGRFAADRSIASRYLTYDLDTHEWDPERVAEYGIPPQFLPEVLPWPSVIGTVKPEVAELWGISPKVQLAMGGHDVNCAAVGAGVSEPGTACLISGSYENMLVMSQALPTPAMLLKGLSVMPHPGSAGYSVLVVCPTGNAVLNWARDLLGIAVDDVESSLLAGVREPGSVLAIPYLSGSMAYWEDGRKAKGALIGLTLATSRVEIVQAFMESVAFDHVNTLALLNQEGVPIDRIRAVGGGARSQWWTQLKADLTGVPVEVVEQQEAGTLGAAILAGLAVGIYNDLEATARAFSGTRRIHEPDPGRAALYRDRLAYYHKTMRLFLKELY